MCNFNLCSFSRLLESGGFIMLFFQTFLFVCFMLYLGNFLEIILNFIIQYCKILSKELISDIVFFSSRWYIRLFYMLKFSFDILLFLYILAHRILYFIIFSIILILKLFHDIYIIWWIGGMLLVLLTIFPCGVGYIFLPFYVQFIF